MLLIKRKGVVELKMAILEVNATRMELKALKLRFEVAKKGHRLLKNKCDGLVRRLSDLNKTVFELRQEVDEGLKKAFLNFELSKVQLSDEQVNFFIECFKSENLLVEMTKKNVMGVRLPVLKAKNLHKFDDFKFLFLQQSQFFDESFKLLSEVFPKLLNLAQLEQSVRIMDLELKQTRRKVNALEFLIMPNYVDTIKSIELKLEENERNNVARLSKIKTKHEF